MKEKFEYFRISAISNELYLAVSNSSNPNSILVEFYKKVGKPEFQRFIERFLLN